MASDTQGPDYRDDPALRPGAAKTLDWGAMCRAAWGTEWAKRDVAYEWSNGRKMEDSLNGPYE